jgi:starch synthase (maltosyl-transferring)
LVPNEGRKRVVVEAVEPVVDGGRFPAKRIVGDTVDVEADVFADGHDRLGAAVRYRPDGSDAWQEAAMFLLDGNDRWRGSFRVTELGVYRFQVGGWVDAFGTWREDLLKRLAAGQDLAPELGVGAQLVSAAARRASGSDAERLKVWAQRLRRPEPQEYAELATSEELAGLMTRYADRRRGASLSPEYRLAVDRERARWGAWYELFPRSVSSEPGRHGTMRDVAELVPDLAERGFDVLYLPPIHPIGHTKRKGPDNAMVAAPDDPGVPWAIGSEEGGHTAVHPDLGTVDDVELLAKTLRAHDMELALDLAFQCSPDHPWVREHPDWFRHHPDGSIRYAENPPKKYEDIVPLDFETADWKSLWEALLEVVSFWVDRGVRIFRVDNPHTKPFAFWEWLIAEIKREHPDVLFLSEAFTRPKVMYRLAKLGFDQSYTYFAWRRGGDELRAYFETLTSSPVVEFFRASLWPNTPDILTDQLQTGAPAAFRLRFVLAATLGANYGIYGPAFEHLEHEPREPGSEEYLHSEKYEIRWRDRRAGGAMRELIARVNAIRHAEPALQHDRHLRFHDTDNPALLAYSKRTPDGSNIVLIVANLDPGFPQSGWTSLDLPELGLAPDAPFVVRDLLSGAPFAWRGARNFVELRPDRQPAHLLRVEPMEAPA